MYSKFYGFSQKPFELNPDPDVVFLSETHQEALSVLRYGVLNRKGFLQLTGDVGTGKSTLLQCLIQSLESNIHLCYIPNPNFTVGEFYYFLGTKFGLVEFDGNKAKFILALGKFLKKCKERNEHALLIIDEAQILSREVLEEIRLLSNQESYDIFGVLSIFLVGQPEFNLLLAYKEFLPLRNRIAISFNIEPFTLTETIGYINFRLHKAGSTTAIFTQNAFREIYRATRGIPRSINILCDNSLLAGYAVQRSIIGEKIICDCERELHYEENTLDANEEELPEPNIQETVSNKEQYQSDFKNRNTFVQSRKVAWIFIVLLFFFIAITTTEYWGKIPGARSLSVWIEKSLAHDLILEPLKYLRMTPQNRVLDFSRQKYPLMMDMLTTIKKVEKIRITLQKTLQLI